MRAENIEEDEATRRFLAGKQPSGRFISADNLTPQKARLLLALALTVTTDPAEIGRIFAAY